MGNLCTKQSRSRSPDPFAQPGRTLGSAPPPRAGTAPVPPKIRGGQRLGGGGGGGGQNSGGEGGQSLEGEAGGGGGGEGAWSQGPSGGGGGGQILGGGSAGGRGGSNDDARRAAARAAEERAAKFQRAPTGKLGRDLASQKAQTRTDTLENISKEERRRRDADGMGDARNWN